MLTIVYFKGGGSEAFTHAADSEQKIFINVNYSLNPQEGAVLLLHEASHFTAVLDTVDGGQYVNDAETLGRVFVNTYQNRQAENDGMGQLLAWAAGLQQ